ncbi:hypothetical protein ACZ90_22590 [Streptomyces albus subsp. albus]|nr:hypothetical protein ACZ90_22590 [Streptomyces albus subsp. albus]
MTSTRTNDSAARGGRRGWTARRVALATAVACLLGATALVPALAGDQQSDGGRTAHPASDAVRGRGQLLSVTPLGTLSRDKVRAQLKEGGIDGSAARYGILRYRLVYRTVDPSGATTTASGLLVLPDGGGQRLSYVSETHGTLSTRAYAPSVGDSLSLGGAYLYAATGHAVAAPDYLGLGRGPGKHPYTDNAAQVTASLDMLRAGRAATERLGRRLTGDVLVTGFSQGGAVAMALGRELDRGAEPGLRLRALAPVSGPYEVEHVEFPALTDGRADGRQAAYYTAYLLVSENRVHGLYASPSEAFRPPYDRTIESLFDGEHEEEEIFAKLPADPAKLLTPRYHRLLRHPSGALLRTVRRLDGTCDWAPRVPVRLYAAHGDRVVPDGNTAGCRTALSDRGVRAEVVDVGDADHFGSYARSVPRIAAWFGSVERRSAD